MSDVRKPVSRRRIAGERPVAAAVVLAVVAVVSMVVGAVVLVAGISERFGSGNGKIDSAQTKASAAAGSAAETIFSFRYDALDDHLSTSQTLMTPAFARDFEKIAPALTELAPQRKIVVQAAARNSAALPCGDDCRATKVDVLVFLDQARLTGGSTTPTVFANRVKVTMVRSDGNWLVSDIRAL